MNNNRMLSTDGETNPTNATRSRSKKNKRLTGAQREKIYSHKSISSKTIDILFRATWRDGHENEWHTQDAGKQNRRGFLKTGAAYWQPVCLQG
jgi:hypothetical protein